jgi:drug/metabolite transporter (DMT)-like permease
MGYIPVLAGLATAFCWGTADYLSRYQSEKVGHYRTVLYSQFTTLLVLVVLLPGFGIGPGPFLLPVLALVAAGVVNFTAFIFLYRAFHKGVVSVVAPIAYTYPAVTVALSAVVLGATISPPQAAAIAAVIAGVVLLSTRFSDLRAYIHGRGPPNATAGVGSAVACSVLFGGVYIGIGYAAPTVSLVLPALVLRVVATGLGFAFAPVLRYDPRPSRLAISNTVIVMSVLEAAGLLLFTYGILAAGASLPIVAALSGMGGGIATFYGLRLLKERLEWNQSLGVAIALIAIFVLLYIGG